MLDHLAEIFGEGSFDEGEQETRFQSLLESGTQLGEDLQNIFDQLKMEVHGTTDQEDLPADSPFALGPAGVGVVKLKSYASPNTS